MRRIDTVGGGSRWTWFGFGRARGSWNGRGGRLVPQSRLTLRDHRRLRELRLTWRKARHLGGCRLPWRDEGRLRERWSQLQGEGRLQEWAGVGSGLGVDPDFGEAAGRVDQEVVLVSEQASKSFLDGDTFEDRGDALADDPAWGAVGGDPDTAEAANLGEEFLERGLTGAHRKAVRLECDRGAGGLLASSRACDDQQRDECEDLVCSHGPPTGQVRRLLRHISRDVKTKRRLCAVHRHPYGWGTCLIPGGNLHCAPVSRYGSRRRQRHHRRFRPALAWIGRPSGAAQTRPSSSATERQSACQHRPARRGTQRPASTGDVGFRGLQSASSESG